MTQETETELLTTIPFSGFYETYNAAIFDDWLEYELEVLQQDYKVPAEKLEDAGEMFADGVEWAGCFNAYAVEYVDYFARKFKLGLKFDSLESPREYNFTTDRIFCSLSVDEAKRIYSLVDKEILAKVLASHFTSRDGFISFYSSEIEALPEHIDAWDCNQLGCLIEAYCLQEEGDDTIHVYIPQEMSSNGVIDNILWEHMNEETQSYFEALRAEGEKENAQPAH
jgi:hypothetical protein